MQRCMQACPAMTCPMRVSWPNPSTENDLSHVHCSQVVLIMPPSLMPTFLLWPALSVCVHAHHCRLVTDITLQRKRRRASLKKRSLEKSKAEGAEYHKLLVQRLKEQRERR